MSTFSKLTSTFVLFLATFGFSNVIGCSADEQIGTEEDLVGSTEQALTAEQCEYFDVNGSVQICHSLGNGKFKILRINEQACINAHSAHATDYVTSTDPASPLYDPTCQGNGCLPENAPCDATLPCCDGSSCQDGTCQPDAPPPNPCSCAENPEWAGAGVTWPIGRCWINSNDSYMIQVDSPDYSHSIFANARYCADRSTYTYQTGGKACTDYLLSKCGQTCADIGGTECGADGCVNVMRDGNNCGACGHQCAPMAPGMGPACEQGVCYYY